MNKMRKIFLRPGKKMAVNAGIVLVLICLYLYSVSSEGFALPYFFTSFLLIAASAIILNLNICLKKIPGIILMILIPPVSFYILESYSHNAFEMDMILQVANIIFFYIFFLILFLLTGSGKAAGIAGSFIFMVIGIANYYTVCFRGSPILPWDLLSVGTAMSVSDNYEFSVEYSMLVPVLGFVLMMVVASKLSVSLPKLKFSEVLERKGMKSFFIRLFARITGMVFCICAVFGIFFGLQVTEIKTFLGLDETLFMPNSLYATNGFSISFIYNMQFIKIDKPDGYSTEYVAQIMEPYMDQNNGANPESNEEVQIEGSVRKTVGAGEGESLMEEGEYRQETVSEDAYISDTDEPSTNEDELPNIIVVMNEAFSDLSVLGDFATNEDYMPFIRNLKEDTVRGNLYVSVKGGNTANTEFEFLTGDTMAFLPQGSVAYQQYVHEQKPTLTSWLANLGYDTAALHPFNASGWDRDEVYPYFGFDTILFYPDFTHRELLRTYVSDASAFAQLIDVYEAKEEGKPIFAFEVTMQNHGGYYNDYDNFTPTIELEIETENSNEKHYTEQYLSLVKKSDEAFEELINYFKNQDEKTIVVMFGDHQPTDIIAKPILEYNGKEEDTSLETQQERYIVPFVIWANYDIEEQEIERLSPNYLASLILDVAELPKSGYQEYLSDLSQILPVITANVYIDAEGNYYNTSENPYAAEIEEYRALQYYHLFDDDKSLSEFYGVIPGESDENS